jgi:hypothetical protein
METFMYKELNSFVQSLEENNAIYFRIQSSQSW